MSLHQFDREKLQQNVRIVSSIYFYKGISFTVEWSNSKIYQEKIANTKLFDAVS